jgi:predicted nucleic acid-binding protein
MALRDQGLWPPLVPSVVLVECLQGHAARDALANRLLKACDVIEEVPEHLARRASQLRRLARRGSAVDALVVATAEPGGTVLTSDPRDLEALAAHSNRVAIERV